MAIKEVRLENHIFKISYAMSDRQKPKWAVFLHGWGANKELMQNAFGESFGEFNHLYIDLPGFGGSSCEVALKTIDYSRIIEAFLEKLKIKPHCVIGHSFGGKVGVLLNPKILVLLSSAGIPKIKSTKVKLKIKLAKMLKFFGLNARILRSKDVENMSEIMYATFKNVVDEDFSGIFGSFGGKALIFWGASDTTTPPYMARKIESLIKDSSLYMLEGDHYFFLNKANIVTIDEVLNAIG